MGRELLRTAAWRIVQAIPLLLIVSVAGFALLQAVPGGPLDMYLSNPNVRPEDVERLRRALGLDQPVAVQYVRWLGALVRGEFGYSYADGRPVADRIVERLPATLELVGSALLVAAAAALPTAVVAARRRGRRFDRVSDAVSLAGISLPVFWTGLVLQLIFAIGLGWLPSAGRTTPADGSVVDRVAHLALPATVLAIAQAAAWSRYLRASMGQALQQPSIQAARARGVGESRLAWRHALRLALAPAITVALLDAAMLVSGAVVTESVFAWPGLGSLFTEALARRDYTVLMAFLMLCSAAVIGLNAVADVVSVAIDPRSREAA